MKKLVLIAFTLLTVVACKQDNPEIKTVEVGTKTTNSSASQKDPNKVYAKAEFKIKGMTCAMGCAKTIEKKLAKLEGVHFAHVNFEKELAMVEFDDSKLSNEDFLNSVAKVSDTYKVEEIKEVKVFTKDLEKN